MASPLDEVEKTIKRPMTSGVSVQTQRALIDLGEHPTITKLPTAAPAAPLITGPGNVQGKPSGQAPVPTEPDNTKGKPSGQVMQEFSGKTPEQIRLSRTRATRRCSSSAG